MSIFSFIGDVFDTFSNNSNQKAAWDRGDAAAARQQEWNWQNMIKAAGLQAQADRTAFFRNMAMDNTKVQRLVADARGAGIHPLAAISGATYSPVGAGGVPGAAGGSIPSYSVGEGSRMGDALRRIKPDPLTQSSIDVNKAQADLLKAQSRTLLVEIEAKLRNGTTGARNLGDPQSDQPSGGVTRPAPNPRNKRITLRGPEGSEIRVLKSTADRLGFKPGDQLTAGEYSELVGEVVGEVVNTLEMDSVSDAQTKEGVFEPARPQTGRRGDRSRRRQEQ